MKKIIKATQVVPPFYGVAYWDGRSNQVICYPLGINLLVIIWRDICDWLRNPKRGY